MGTRTVVADVADELARRVATGEYRPGDLMPSVRQVAEEFGMNRATAQLTLGRLESYGFVEARRGKGFTIRDVREDGSMDAYRHLFRFSITAPGVAAEMFADIVEVERAIVLEALLAYTGGEKVLDPVELAAAVDELEALAREAVPDHARIITAEVALVRRVLGVLGMSMQRAVLNSITDMVLEVPEAVTAYFAVAADLHVLVWRALLAVWDADTGPTEAQLALFADLFALFHEKVIARFDALVGLGAVDTVAATA
ncbi:GntR family transcriptional regulator [Nocardia halotolerans]|uniref:GntR family transcriptional regulator n=1 Tax=Nocardia halotolerans TaxID=1755878 RepID=A0ABV8VFY2_9NOCA